MSTLKRQPHAPVGGGECAAADEAIGIGQLDRLLRCQPERGAQEQHPAVEFAGRQLKQQLVVNLEDHLGFHILDGIGDLDHRQLDQIGRRALHADTAVLAIRGEADRLRDPLVGWNLRGYLTGTVDLVLRKCNADGSPSFALVDYKSNRMSVGADRRCVPSGFGAAALRHEMARHDYFLQYHLYLVALHRYLAWRLPDYDYDRDVGGVYYLFLSIAIPTPKTTDGSHATLDIFNTGECKSGTGLAIWVGAIFATVFGFGVAFLVIVGVLLIRPAGLFGTSKVERV